MQVKYPSQCLHILFKDIERKDNMKIRAVLMDDEMLYVDEFLKALRQNFKNSDIFTEEQEDTMMI